MYSQEKSKKIINRNNMYEITLNRNTLRSQLTKRKDAIVLKFSGEMTSESMSKRLKMFAKAMNSLKKARKAYIECLFCSQLTDKDLKNLCEGLRRLSSLKSIRLGLES